MIRGSGCFEEKDLLWHHRPTYAANLNSTRTVGGLLGRVAALSGVSSFSIECIGSGFIQVTRQEPG